MDRHSKESLFCNFNSVLTRWNKFIYSYYYSDTKLPVTKYNTSRRYRELRWMSNEHKPSQDTQCNEESRGEVGVLMVGWGGGEVSSAPVSAYIKLAISCWICMWLRRRNIALIRWGTILICSSQITLPYLGSFLHHRPSRGYLLL